MKADFDVAAHTARRFTFEVQPNAAGRRVLHFPYMSRSDIHWGTQYSRAKRLCHMEQNTSADMNDYLGDVYDGVQVLEKKTWNLGPWHRQGMAHILRKAGRGEQVKVFQGNHEHGINNVILHDGQEKPHRQISGKRIYDVDFTIEEEHIDLAGRRVLRLHGDKHDSEIFKSEESRGFWYRIGDAAYASLYGADRKLRALPGMEHFSLAATGKKAVKTIINQYMGINKVISKALDASPYDVMIYGHSHMPGFSVTPKGKLLINDGCCTEHVNALVQDKNGQYAILTWHRDHMEVEEQPRLGPSKFVQAMQSRQAFIDAIEQAMEDELEFSPDIEIAYHQAQWDLQNMETELADNPALGYVEGPKYKVSFAELGLEEALEPAEALEDAYSARADKMIRLLYRAWPTKDRTDLLAQIRVHQDIIDRARIRQKLDLYPDAPRRAFYVEAVKARDALKAQLPPVPAPRPSAAQLSPQSAEPAIFTPAYQPPQNNEQGSYDLAV